MGVRILGKPVAWKKQGERLVRKGKRANDAREWERTVRGKMEKERRKRVTSPGLTML